MKKIAIITNIAFWRKGAGNKSRLAVMSSYLARRIEIIVLFSGHEVADDRQLLRALPVTPRVIFCEKDRLPGLLEFGERVAAFLEDNPVDCCMIEYVELSFLMDFIPPGIKMLLDTHDISSDRALSFAQFENEKGTSSISYEEEIDMFLRYDKVILINSDDYDKISCKIGAEKTLLVPHAPVIRTHPHRPVVKNIGFVGSDYLPNEDAIVFFSEKIWPHVHRPGLGLHVYGHICELLDSELASRSGIQLEGFVRDDNEIYSKIDIVINPVRFGAGLKIKNLEALANGLPLVTTRHGSGGLAAGKNRAFLQADDVDEWVAQLERLIDDPMLRFSLGEEGLKFVTEQFQPDRCYGELMRYIESC
ncbi:MAG: glycosyltransferase family 4 protein [Chitinophagaceae bacterium]|nr:glycosyltransferase family 4 protein [Chitinophagaceae bacterium]